MVDVPDTSTRSISEYTLLEFLGEGATAQVYLAQHETSGANVAIKVIDKLLIRRAQLENKIRQEMVLHAELRHPNVLHVESVFEDARNYYMILEYCAQRSIAAVVKTLPSRKLDEKMAKNIFRQALAGVMYLHASGVIHRDLKLANLLLSDTGEVKISDFGLATRLGDNHVTMCGTPNFIAPEVLMAENEPYDEAVDVWSLGCILYCLLIGKPPFEGRKVGETLENVANAGQNPLQFPDGLSSSAIDLVKRLLTSDPRSRPSAEQISHHPWLREHYQKKMSSSSSLRHHLLSETQRVPSNLRAASRLPERIRKSRQASPNCSIIGEEYEESSASSPVLAMARRRRYKNSKQRRPRHAVSRKVKICQRQSTSAGSSSANSSPDDDSSSNEDINNLSESLLSIKSFDHNESGRGNDNMSQADATPHFEDSSCAHSVISVVMHLQVQSISCFGICNRSEDDADDTKLQLQWRCKEPTEIGETPTFELDVSNGWRVCYDPRMGVLTATTPEGEFLRFEIPGLNKAQSGSNSAITARTIYRVRLPLLVRFCQCLALRILQLRQIALRNQASKLPYIHYDTIPESLLASFQYRLSLLTHPPATSFLNKSNHDSADVNCTPYTEKSIKQVEISGVGCGCIDSTGDLRVTFLDGAQLTLVASGLQLRFRPSWVNDADHQGTEDVFELLTNSSMSAFLPSISNDGRRLVEQRLKLQVCWSLMEISEEQRDDLRWRNIDCSESNNKEDYRQSVQESLTQLPDNVQSTAPSIIVPSNTVAESLMVSSFGGNCPRKEKLHVVVNELSNINAILATEKAETTSTVYPVVSANELLAANQNILSDELPAGRPGPSCKPITDCSLLKAESVVVDKRDNDNEETNIIGSLSANKLSSDEMVLIMDEQNLAEWKTDEKFAEMLKHLQRGKLEHLALQIDDITNCKLIQVHGALTDAKDSKQSMPYVRTLVCIDMLRLLLRRAGERAVYDSICQAVQQISDKEGTHYITSSNIAAVVLNVRQDLTLTFSEVSSPGSQRRLSNPVTNRSSRALSISSSAASSSRRGSLTSSAADRRSILARDGAHVLMHEKIMAFDYRGQTNIPSAFRVRGASPTHTDAAARRRQRGLQYANDHVSHRTIN
ncbi:plk protein kinase [Plasmopara halstedii]|uniref:Plk protein kinase n=1 Tax=Plasmopara halstedii TaxID=4781 RepID=A0A0P1AHV0_PLAHL|nr:plk protein kinase [Plasmopara halstedii]CEG40457.1 plk protein kinase [Plasmopara halstedii]|eukprot:XP_024576826.1 plk protein kinase [Plasmopara halstedii]